MIQCRNESSPVEPLSTPFGSGSLAPPAIQPSTPLVCVNDLEIVPLEARRLVVDDQTAVPTEAQNSIGIQDDLRIMVDVAPSRNFLQRRAISLAPMTHVPTEILAYIFKLSLVEDDSKSVLVSASGPLYLAQVCKLWKAIAESDPRFWTSIHLYFPDAHQNRQQDVQRVRFVLDLHLKWSGTLPISLTFTDNRSYHEATTDLIALLTDRLRAHSYRWKRISLHLSCGYFPLLFTFMPCDLSSLEHLCISGDVLGQRTATTLHLNVESAKSLRSFAYSGPGHGVNDRIDLDWEQLAEVSFEFVPHYGMSLTLSRHLTYLAECRNVTTCSLGIDRPFWSDFDDVRVITLPFLQTLRIRRLSPQSHVHSVVNLLVLPRLQTLEIDAAYLIGWNGRYRPWHVHHFSNLLARSGCALRHLSIQDVDFPNDELVRCLAVSRKLTSLRFIPYPRSQNITDVIRALDVSHPSSAMVPQLGRYRSNTSSWIQVQNQGRGQDGQKHVGNGPLTPELCDITLASSVDGYLRLMIEMCRSRRGACARTAGVTAMRNVEVIFFNMTHGSANGFLGNRSAKVTRLQMEMAQWVSDVQKDEKKSERDERLKASVVVDSPYLAEYINIL